MAGAHDGGIALDGDYDIVLIPITHQVVVDHTSGDDSAILGFYDLTDGLAEWASALSRSVPTAYVDVESFGGTGFQAAIGWSDGEVVLGPLFTQTHAGEAEAHYHIPVNGEPMAVNAVLLWLGVSKGAAKDEFEAVGLGRFRHTDWWPSAVEETARHRRNQGRGDVHGAPPTLRTECDSSAESEPHYGVGFDQGE